MTAPFNLTDRTRPSLMLKRRTVTLHERAIESGIVRNDDNGICREGGNAIRVKVVAIDHLVGNPGESRNLGGMATDGWLKQLNVSRARVVRPSGRYANLTIPSSMI